MPIYAYKCESCGFAKDVLQKMSDAPLADCPSCGQPAFKKQLTSAGFHLKGSGWYATDFKGAAASAPAAPVDSDAASTSKTADSPKPVESNVAKSEAVAAPAAATAASGCGGACACH